MNGALSGTGRNGQAVASSGSSIDWGTTAVGTFNSAYFFDGQPVSTDAAGLFSLGTFTHRNGTIWSSESNLGQAELQIGISGTLAGQAFSLDRTLDFTHDETLNECKTCGGPADHVTVSAFDPFSLVVTTAEGTYTLLIGGLSEALGGATVDRFTTVERAYTSLVLWGRLTFVAAPPPPVVPLPAGGLLLVSALGAAGLARRFRRR